MEKTLVEQNGHWTGEPYVFTYQREHDRQAIEDLVFDEIQLITGTRRCGKSTLMFRVINHLMGLCSPKSILYINFDDPNYHAVCNECSKIADLVILAEKLTGDPVEYLFLDEVQNVIAWEKYVKSVYDSARFKKIVVTGSNADLLNSDYASLLSGRYVRTHIYPLSFFEILINHGINNKIQLYERKSDVLRLLDGFMQYGGFPRAQLLNDDARRKRLLQNYYETILLKDCLSQHNIRDTKVLMDLAYYLVSNISTLYSYNSLAKAIGSNENTVSQFIKIFEGSYFLTEINQFSYSLKSQIKSKKKIYSIDNGLIAAVSYKVGSNFGKMFENLVYSELTKQNFDTLNFYNDTKECDFIAKKNDTILAIQACYELNDQNQAREINGLKAAMEAYQIKNGLIITYDQEKILEENIKVLPFWKYCWG